ncbi:unnamed protein product [Mycena citricolor]|uniref:Uncharacterized protein n=1 Tax=Mycena citricolor TaxID=2018698 RepID=A0AAD2JVL8_9AGAR|nr:unnamed protein product [Mycena citricolor]
MNSSNCDDFKVSGPKHTRRYSPDLAIAQRSRGGSMSSAATIGRGDHYRHRAVPNHQRDINQCRFSCTRRIDAEYILPIQQSRCAFDLKVVKLEVDKLAHSAPELREALVCFKPSECMSSSPVERRRDRGCGQGWCFSGKEHLKFEL